MKDACDGCGKMISINGLKHPITLCNACIGDTSTHVVNVELADPINTEAPDQAANKAWIDAEEEAFEAGHEMWFEATPTQKTTFCRHSDDSMNYQKSADLLHEVMVRTL